MARMQGVAAHGWWRILNLLRVPCLMSSSSLPCSLLTRLSFIIFARIFSFLLFFDVIRHSEAVIVEQK
jgi:hypothetical protein